MKKVESHSTNTSLGNTSKAVLSDIDALHRRCGVYTRPEIVNTILDDVGWVSENDLSHARLLEPAAGDGSFLVEAVGRLIGSFKRHHVTPSARTLVKRILAFELHSTEAKLAQQRLARLLRDHGLHHNTIRACTRSWVLNEDFLLSKLPSCGFTHIVGNPPYVRWSKVPLALRKQYEKVLPTNIARGDLFLPFFDRSLSALQKNGHFSFLCSDRWRFMQFAEGFRRKWLPVLDVHSERRITANEAFLQNVSSYPMILTASVRNKPKRHTRTSTNDRKKSLADLGYVVKVGPALGCTRAYVLEPDEHDVTDPLLLPWIAASEISDGSVAWRGRRVLAMHDTDGNLIDIEKFPLLKSRLLRFRKQLATRTIVVNGAPWFRPIDRIHPLLWQRPKILVPELAKVPRAAIDRSGAVPSHAVYAIFAPDDNIDDIYVKLKDGKLAAALHGIAPTIRGDYVRCYRRFLLQVRI